MGNEHRLPHPLRHPREPGLLPFLLAEDADDAHGRHEAVHPRAEGLVAFGHLEAESFEALLDEVEQAANDPGAGEHEQEEPPIQPGEKRAEHEQAQHRGQDREHRVDRFRHQPTVGRDDLHQPGAIVLEEEIVLDVEDARGKRVAHVAADAAVDPVHQGDVAGLHQASNDDQRENGDADRRNLRAGRIGAHHGENLVNGRGHPGRFRAGGKQRQKRNEKADAEALEEARNQAEDGDQREIAAVPADDRGKGAVGVAGLQPEEAAGNGSPVDHCALQPHTHPAVKHKGFSSEENSETPRRIGGRGR